MSAQCRQFVDMVCRVAREQVGSRGAICDVEGVQVVGPLHAAGAWACESVVDLPAQPLAGGESLRRRAPVPARHAVWRDGQLDPQQPSGSPSLVANCGWKSSCSSMRTSWVNGGRVGSTNALGAALRREAPVPPRDCLVHDVPTLISSSSRFALVMPMCADQSTDGAASRMICVENNEVGRLRRVVERSDLR